MSLWLLLKSQASLRMTELSAIFSSFLGTEMVDLYVGQERRHFHIHKNPLCKKVPYFHAMFNSGMKESLQNQAEFPEDSPVAFESLIRWVYQDSVPQITFIRQQDVKYITEDDFLLFYKLADKFCLFDLCDKIVDSCIDLGLLTVELMNTFCENSRAESGLRHYCCYVLHRYTRAGEGIRHQSGVHHEPLRGIQALLSKYEDMMSYFLLIMREQGNLAQPVDPSNLPRCHFHCHGSDKPCYLDGASRR